MNHVTKHIIYLLLNSNNPSIIVHNLIIHNKHEKLDDTRTKKFIKREKEYVNNQNYNLDSARKESLIMLKDSPHLRYKGPRPLYLNGNYAVQNSRVYAYLGEFNDKIMYAKYTLNDRNKNMLYFNSWHISIYPDDPRFIQLY